MPSEGSPATHELRLPSLVYPNATYIKQKPVAQATGSTTKQRNKARFLFLPSAFLVAIRLQALSALVLVHLQTTLLFQIAHGE